MSSSDEPSIKRWKTLEENTSQNTEDLQSTAKLAPNSSDTQKTESYECSLPDLDEEDELQVNGSHEESPTEEANGISRSDSVDYLPKLDNVTVIGTVTVQTSSASPRDKSDVRTDSSETLGLVRIKSVMNDATTIASMLNIDNVDAVYEMVKSQRKAPNRLEYVANKILEDGLEDSDEELCALAEIIEAGNNSGTSKQPAPTDFDFLWKDMQALMKLLQTKYRGLKFDENSVYAQLEKFATKPNRVQFVFQMIVDMNEKVEAANNKSQNVQYSDLVDEVDEVQAKCPFADAFDIYQLLDENSTDPNRKQKVTDILKNNMGAGESVRIGNTKRPSEEQLVANDPIYKDMCKLAKIFPNRDKNEIYAYLEANYHEKNRVDLVMEELLHLQELSQENKARKASPVKAEADSSQDITSDCSQGTGELSSCIPKEERLMIKKLEMAVETVKQMFPDCDPMFLYEELANIAADANRVETLCMQLSEGKSYPKLADRTSLDKQCQLREKLQGMKLDIEGFLKLFPDPVAEFETSTKTMTDHYKSHLERELKNRYQCYQAQFLYKVALENNFRLLLTVQDLETDALQHATEAGQSPKKIFVNGNREVLKLPDKPDEYFYWERLYLDNQDIIKDYISELEERRKCRLDEARVDCVLQECGCCFDTEILPEEVVECSEGHLYCQDCVRRSVEVAFGESKTKFPCLSLDCEATFPISSLQSAVDHKTLSAILKRVQQDEVEQADIEGLETCPFCTYATIMENNQMTVFKCLNPECLKESCRLCRELSHIPMRCDEVEQDSERKIRTFIEQRMSEAMLRTCWQCRKPFYKTEGCNHMTCVCGAHMCYVCRAPLLGDPYVHFSTSNCPSNTDEKQLHYEEMQKAVREAKERYMTPSQTLLYDPSEHLKDYLEAENSKDYDEESDDDSDDS